MQVRPDIASRIIEAVLRISTSNKPISIMEVSQVSLTSMDETRRILGLLEIEESAVLSEEEKVRAILNALRLGVDASSLARYLDWREFERLATSLLGEAGYEVEWNVRLSYSGRRVQVDVMAYNGSILLIIDCKRWNRPLTPSAELRIREGQEKRLFLLKSLIEYSFSQEGSKIVYIIPATLSLYKSSKPIIDGFIFASLDKLRGALEYVERSFFQLRNEKATVPSDFTLKQIVRRLQEKSRPRKC
jgi:hypothetical protein